VKGGKVKWNFSSHLELEAASYRFRGQGQCRGALCMREILWYETPKSKKLIPIDPGTFAPHHSTCPEVQDFRAKKGPGS
jgi:hypothetical protein